MKIRIYETDFEGNPVECTGEYFSGATALDIVNAMKMNPFQASRTPLEFMRWMLAGYCQCDENEPVSGKPDSAGVHAMDACKYRTGKVRPS